eukprot:2718805-Amphidinium_carterae.2
MSVVLGLEKGRMASEARPALMAVCKNVCVHAILSGTTWRHRWVASEFNPADHGSRLWESAGANTTGSKCGNGKDMGSLPSSSGAVSPIPSAASSRKGQIESSSLGRGSRSLLADATGRRSQSREGAVVLCSTGGIGSRDSQFEQEHAPSDHPSSEGLGETRAFQNSATDALPHAVVSVGAGHKGGRLAIDSCASPYVSWLSETGRGQCTARVRDSAVHTGGHSTPSGELASGGIASEFQGRGEKRDDHCSHARVPNFGHLSGVVGRASQRSGD